MLDLNAPARWTPRNIPGLKLWLDAQLSPLWQDSAMTTKAAADADPVGAWGDYSGNGNHALQATAGKRPALKLAIQAGRPVLRFTAASSQEFGLSSGLGMLRNVAGGTLVVVASSTTPLAVAAGLIAITGGTGGPRARMLTVVGSGDGDWDARGRRLDADSTAFAFGGTPDTSWHVLSATFDYAGGAITGRADGTQFGTGVLTMGNTSDTDSTAIAIGSGNGLQYWGGDIAAILIYNRTLVAAERSRVEKNLGSRWGVTVA